MGWAGRKVELPRESWLAWVPFPPPDSGSRPPVVRILFTALYFHVREDKICRRFHKSGGGSDVRVERGKGARREGGVTKKIKGE